MRFRGFVTSTSVVAGFASIALAPAARAGGDKVAFPENYASGTLYGTVDRYDIKQYRELFATPAAVDAVRKGEPIPSDTVITMVQYKAQLDAQGSPVKDANGRFVKGDLVGYAVMEKRTGWGAEYPDDIRNGEWEYQAFTADKKVNDKANLRNCFVCHKPHEKQDFVISLAALKGTAPDAPAAARSGPGTVSIASFLFGPEKLTVAPGTTVTWTNTDRSPHQVSVKDRPLRSGVILRGQSESLTFNEPGTYEYTCGLHPSMKGTIEVK
jgi:plastocyanin